MIRRCQWIMSHDIVKQKFAWTSVSPICISKCFDKWRRGELFGVLFLVMLNLYENVACICFLLQCEQLPKQYWNVRTRCTCVRLKLHKWTLLRYRTNDLPIYVKITKPFLFMCVQTKVWYKLNLCIYLMLFFRNSWLLPHVRLYHLSRNPISYVSLYYCQRTTKLLNVIAISERKPPLFLSLQIV